MVLSGRFDHTAEMVVAVIIGIGFGFSLERAGFGHAKNLTSIFYGRDFRVMRVMFTAILVAMVGLYTLDLAGVMPISNIGLLPTYVGPQLVGGLLLGAGFIIGGYCPGTSIVATMSGKIDALLFVGGIFLGVVAFDLAYPALAAWHQSGAMGRILLHELFGLSSAVMVPLVVVFAVGALFAVGRIERAVRARLTARGIEP
jgi:hypothetical protein